MTPKRLLKTSLFTVKVAASLSLLYLAVRGLDLGSALGLVGSSSPWMFAVAALTTVCTHLLGGTRWHGLLIGHLAVIPLRRAMSLSLIGAFFNSALPSTVGGDAARIIYATRDGAAPSGVVLSILLDRFVGVSGSALVSLIVIVVQPFGLVLPPLWRAVVAVLCVGVLGGIAALLLFNMLMQRRAVSAVVGRLSPWLASHLVGVRVSFRALGAAALWTIALISGVGLTLALLDMASGGGLGLARALAIAAPIILATSLPISMAGWGVREVVMVEMFEVMALPSEAGLAISVLFGLTLFAAGIPGLVLWVTLRRADAVKA